MRPCGGRVSFYLKGISIDGLLTSENGEYIQELAISCALLLLLSFTHSNSGTASSGILAHIFICDIGLKRISSWLSKLLLL